MDRVPQPQMGGTVRTVRRLLPPTQPPGAEVDPVAHAWDVDRTAREDRPWVLVNMIASVDGAASIDGLSAGLGGPGDRAMFHALREVPDVILVAAGTVRAEGYRPLRPTAEVRARRVEHGREPLPRLAIVSASLDLDPTDAIFTSSESRPIVITGAGSPPERRAELEVGADMLVTSGDRADLGEALRRLRADGVEVVLCEGGPSLLGQLVADDLVDELDLTMAPSLVSGDTARIAHGPSPVELLSLRIDAICEQDDLLLLRHLRTRP